MDTPALVPDACRTGADGACCSAVKSFVQRRMDAEEFLPRFASLWRGVQADSAPLTAAANSAGLPKTGFRDVLGAISDLCETYTRALSPGGGYRVSEEQFRKGVECMALKNQLLGAGIC